MYLLTQNCILYVPTLWSLLSRGTMGSCPSCLRGPREKEGKEKLTGPTELLVLLAVVVAVLTWAEAVSRWRARRRRRWISIMVVRGGTEGCWLFWKHLKQRIWAKVEMRRHSTFCPSSPQSCEHWKSDNKNTHLSNLFGFQDNPVACRTVDLILRQGCTNRCSLAAGLRGKREWGNEEEMERE